MVRLASAVVVAIAVAPAAAVAKLVAEPKIPTPLECASGKWNGYWPGGTAERFATCIGGGGHVIEYVGGNVATPCGAVIVDDQVLAGVWTNMGPDYCPAAAAKPSPNGAGGRFRPVVRGRAGAIASPSVQASAAGLEVLQEGGNAVDAAAAIAFALGVTRPEWSGLGGGGYLVYRGADGKTAALDFRTRAPAAVTPTSFSENGFDSLGTGHRVVGVPGLVDGMAKLVARFGALPLARAVGPAVRLASKGIVVTPEMASDYGGNPALYVVTPELAAADPFVDPTLNRARFELYPEAARIFVPNGLNPAPGQILVQPDAARTLELIARDGRDAFYRGPIAHAIADDMARSQSSLYPGDQGLMTLHDLETYEAKWYKPLAGSYRGHKLIAMPPSTSGGIVTLEVLNILEGFDLAKAGRASADDLHLLAEAQKLAWADRSAYIGDPDFVHVPTTTLIDKAYAAKRRALIDLHKAGTYKAGTIEGYTPAGGGTAPSRAPAIGGHTAHLAVIDRAGNAVSLTTSIGGLWGSSVVAPDTGFLLNDDLGYGAANSAEKPEGGRRKLSSMSPTIVVRRGAPDLVIGGAGSELIPMGVIQGISNTIDFVADPALALDLARVDEQTCCLLSMEDQRFSTAVKNELAARGHQLAANGEYSAYPLVQAVGVNPMTRERLAAADPRDEPGTLVQPGAGLPLPALKVRATPAVLIAGKRTRIRFVVTMRVAAKRVAARGAVIRLAGRSAKADRRGRASLFIRPRRPGRLRAVVKLAGTRRGVAVLTVRAARRKQR